MAEKPIIVAVGRNNPDDLIEYTDPSGQSKQRMGLLRCVPYEKLNGTFKQLLTYMCDPIGQDGNPTYEGKERELGTHIQREYVDKNEGYVQARRAGQISKDREYSLETQVMTVFGNIVEPKTMQAAGQNVDYKSIDLLVAINFQGGYK